mmetsp:Transcript_4308/g.10426  ORF Transcript_4308/g.10426 Transcript_4308/m.10426 type:complete len:307 (+) Transcript_4308:3577-4497(+)
MRFCVRVPVLSAFSCVALPIVSHASRRRTRFWSAIILRMAKARPSVMASGRPSGMAATVSVTATRIMNSHEGVSGSSGSRVSSAMPTMNTMRQMAMAKYPMVTASFSRLTCSGDCPDLVSGMQLLAFFFLGAGGGTPASMSAADCATATSSSSPEELSSAAMDPTRVCMPVATMMPTPVPALTLQEENAMLSAVSFSGTPGTAFFTLVFLATSSGSPVRSISLTRRSLALTMRRSAGTTSPVPSFTTSPGTRFTESTWTSSPPRITVVMGDCSEDSASRASFALFSVTAAIVALIITMMKMAMAST